MLGVLSYVVKKKAQTKPIVEKSTDSVITRPTMEYPEVEAPARNHLHDKSPAPNKKKFTRSLKVLSGLAVLGTAAFLFARIFILKK